MAYSVVHELKSRLQAGCVSIFSTNGLKHYYYALTTHFGEWIDRDGEKKPVWLVLSEFMYAQVDQAAGAFPTRERGVPLVMGQCRRIPVTSESKWIEWEYQYIICGKSESYNSTICLEVNAAHMGTGTAEIGTGGLSVLVAGRFALSLRSFAREFARQITRTDTEEGQTETEAVSEGNFSNGSRANLPTLVGEGTDQLSAAIKAMGEERLKGNVNLLP